ncbi:unnamed protein product [Caenorhabditis bovis]|uniref:Ankyrin repeat domain-containing protein n=1 Tax=Caenorhabditis bovis TaxID=2654633 RepID=A0A8S1EQ37_9PELO|nr:unnamed protein product [Caenorhabditis bovis]
MENDLNDFESQAIADAGHELGFTKELIDEIRDQKEQNPGMFVSAWQDDNEGIAEKNMKDPKEIWLTAAEEGKLEDVKEILENSPEILNAHDADGYTALHRAAYNNHVDVVELLLKSGVDTEARTRDGWTALHSASNWGNYEVVGKLISHGVDVNALSHGNLTALHLAVQSQNEDPDNVFHTVRYLLQAPGIDASVPSNNGDTPLQMAYRSSGSIYHLIKNFLERP